MQYLLGICSLPGDPHCQKYNSEIRHGPSLKECTVWWGCKQSPCSVNQSSNSDSWVLRKHKEREKGHLTRREVSLFLRRNVFRTKVYNLIYFTDGLSRVNFDIGWKSQIFRSLANGDQLSGDAVWCLLQPLFWKRVKDFCQSFKLLGLI